MSALNFSAQFADAVRRGDKCQTIRRRGKRQPPLVGEALTLYSGMRTQQCQFLRTAVCSAVTLIGISPGHHEVSMPRDYGSGQVVQTPLDADEVERLARADGFANADAFFGWFMEAYGGPISGYLIEWKP